MICARSLVPFLCGILFLTTLAISGCGKAKGPAGDLNSNSADGDFNEGEDSTGYDSDYTDSTADALDSMASLTDDPEQQEALLAARPGLDQMQKSMALFQQFGVNDAIELAQLLREYDQMQQKAEAAAERLRRARLDAIAVLFTQMKNMKPVLRVRDVRTTGVQRIYYTSDPERVDKLRKTLGKTRFRNDGVAFMVWSIDKPVPQNLYPNAAQIETKPVYVCNFTSGGSFVSNEQDCESRKGVNKKTSVLMGYTSKTADIPQLEVQRFKHKSDAARILVTIKGDPNTTRAAWKYEKDLGGSAVVRVVISLGLP